MRRLLVWSGAGVLVLALVVMAGLSKLEAKPRISETQVSRMMQSEGVTYGDCVLPSPGDQPICTATPEPPVFETGVFQGEQDGPISHEFNQRSQWVGYDSDGNEVIVGVGSQLHDNRQGVVVVDDVGNVTGDQGVKSYESPGRDGALDILSADGSALSLQATDGTTWTFDVATGSFTSDPR